MRIHVAHILVAQKYEAEDILRKIGEGTIFAELAKRYSTCPSAKAGGDLGPVDSNRLDDDFAKAAAQLKAGEISPIVRTRFGYHLICKLG